MNFLRRRALDVVGKLFARDLEEVAAGGDGSRQAKIVRIMVAAGLTHDDLEGWAADHGVAYDDDEGPADDTQAADPTQATVAMVTLWPGYEDLRDRGQLIARLHSTVGTQWQVETIDGDQARVVAGTPSSRPDAVEGAPGEDARATSAPMVAGWLDSQGLSLVEWDFTHRRQVASRLCPWEKDLRDRVASYLKIQPWDVELQVGWTVGSSGVGEPAVITVLRAPAESNAERRREKWLEIVTAAVPAPFGTTWWVEDDSARGRLILRRAEDPLGEIIAYPWDAPVSVKAVPFAMDSTRKPVTLGLLEVNQLLGGNPGGGKSGGLTALLCGIARLENVAIIGLDPKRVELAPWKSRFSRIARFEEDATAVLEAVIEEMEERYEWLESRGLKKLSPAELSPEMPLIVRVRRRSWRSVVLFGRLGSGPLDPPPRAGTYRLYWREPGGRSPSSTGDNGRWVGRRRGPPGRAQCSHQGGHVLRRP